MLRIINEPTAAAIAYGLDKKLLAWGSPCKEREGEREREREGERESEREGEREREREREGGARIPLVNAGLVHGED